MVQLTGLKTKKATSGGSKKEYPILPDQDGSVAQMVANLCDAKAHLDQWQGTYDANKCELISLSIQDTFQSGRTPATIKATGPNGATVSISLQNRYYGIPVTAEGPDGEIENPRITALKKAMGDKFDRYMETKTEITIDLDKIPEQNQQAFIDYLVNGAGLYDGEDAIVAKQVVAPRPSFHLDRGAEFTAAQNHEIHKQLPLTAVVKAKGVSL